MVVQAHRLLHVMAPDFGWPSFLQSSNKTFPCFTRSRWNQFSRCIPVLGDSHHQGCNPPSSPESSASIIGSLTGQPNFLFAARIGRIGCQTAWGPDVSQCLVITDVHPSFSKSQSTKRISHVERNGDWDDRTHGR